MRFVSPEDVFREEHEVMGKAFAEWIGMNKECSAEDISYLWGVHDMATKLAEFAVTSPFSAEEIVKKVEDNEHT